MQKSRITMTRDIGAFRDFGMGCPARSGSSSWSMKMEAVGLESPIVFRELDDTIEALWFLGRMGGRFWGTGVEPLDTGSASNDGGLGLEPSAAIGSELDEIAPAGSGGEFDEETLGQRCDPINRESWADRTWGRGLWEDWRG